MNLNEVAPPTKKHERMVKHIKKSYKKDGKLTDDEKSIAYATAWKNYNEGKYLTKASVLSASDDPKDQDKAREIRTRFDYESLKKQIGNKKKPRKPAVSTMDESLSSFVKFRKKAKEKKKASMDSTTDKLHNWRKKTSDKQKEHEKYVNFLPANED